jgi:cephalosporin hydroxylase
MGHVRARAAAAKGPIMVILDRDHREEHVFQEMELYGPLVTTGSFMLVQDGVIDLLPFGRGDRPARSRPSSAFSAGMRNSRSTTSGATDS